MGRKELILIRVGNNAHRGRRIVRHVGELLAGRRLSLQGRKLIVDALVVDDRILIKRLNSHTCVHKDLILTKVASDQSIYSLLTTHYMLAGNRDEDVQQIG